MLDDSAGVLHATVSDGVVWFTRDSERPRSTSRPIADFAASNYCRKIRELRVLATAANSSLIASALPIAQARGFRVLLASPLLVPTRTSRNNPRIVLAKSLELSNPGFCPPASVGGWHTTTPDERLVYLAAARLCAGAPSSELASILEPHPLWERLTFVSPCDPEALARVAACIRDPRWFVNAASPDSARRLYNFMGFNDKCGESGALDRRALVSAVWNPPDRVAPGVSKQPRGFLWRHYFKLSAAGAPAVEHRTSKLFLRFLRNVWLGVIAEAGATRGDSLFVPEYFFDWALEGPEGKDPFAAIVAKAYADHIETAAPSGV